MPTPQNLKNHTRFDPSFHFFILPMLLLNLIFSIYVTIHHWPEHWALHLWWIAMAIVFFVMPGLARGGALTVQDRIIRLEERLRYQRLLPADLQLRIEEFTVAQLVSLRFASDAELPALARKVLDEKMQERKAIKQLVKNWKPDYLRA